MLALSRDNKIERSLTRGYNALFLLRDKNDGEIFATKSGMCSLLCDKKDRKIKTKG